MRGDRCAKTMRNEEMGACGLEFCNNPVFGEKSCPGGVALALVCHVPRASSLAGAHLSLSSCCTSCGGELSPVNHVGAQHGLV